CEMLCECWTLGGRVDELQGLAGCARCRCFGPPADRNCRRARRTVCGSSRGPLSTADVGSSTTFRVLRSGFTQRFFKELRARARDAADKTRQAFEHNASCRGVSAEWREIPEGADADPALHAR